MVDRLAEDKITMHISGLVVAFEPVDAALHSTMATIGRAGPFTLGELIGRRLSLAMEVTSSEEALRWHRWLSELPGVLDVNIAFVTLENEMSEQVLQEATYVL